MCPRCPFCELGDSLVIRRGFFPRRRAPGGRVQRYVCRGCRRTFSDQTLSPTYRERKPEVNQAVFRLLCMGVSQRETAHALALHPVLHDTRDQIAAAAERTASRAKPGQEGCCLRDRGWLI